MEKPLLLPPLVLLAAGLSQRTGEPKGLMRVDGRPWLEHQIESFGTAGGVSAFVVLGSHAERFRKGCPWLDENRDFAGVRVRTVVNPSPERGPFSSLQAGLRAFPAEKRGAFLQPVDVPCAGVAVWQALARELGNRLVAQPRCEGSGGHPILISRRWVAPLLAQSLDARLDRLMETLGDHEIRRVCCHDARVLLNLNTLADWRRYFGSRLD